MFLSTGYVNIYLMLCHIVVLILPSHTCPVECLCKWKGGKRTAECGDRGLISVPFGIEMDTQVLDLSANDIQVLLQNAFKSFGLISLQKMYMRSCRLGQIDQNAFQGLQNLVELDLSNNLLTEVPSQAFADIPYLRNISLANNPIQRIDPFSFSVLPQLSKLDLSQCKIEVIRPYAFDNLHVLDNLKLNENLMQQLSADVVRNLTKLKTIELQGNQWVCDCRLRRLKLWMLSSSVHLPEPLFCLSGPERLKDESILDLDVDDFACQPSLRTENRHLEVAIGSNLTIECHIQSDPEARVSWYFERVQLSNNSIYGFEQRIFITETNDDGGSEKRSRLVVMNVEESDAGNYHCVADNRAGNAEANFTLRLLPPNASIIMSISSLNLNAMLVVLGAMIVVMIVVIVILCKKIDFSCYDDDDDDDADEVTEKKDHQKQSLQNHPAHLEKCGKGLGVAIETCSQRSNDSDIIKHADSCKAFTVVSDLSLHSRSFSSEIGCVDGVCNPHHQFSNPDLISGANMRRDSTCVTPLPITRPISDYYQNWQKSYGALPPPAPSRNASSLMAATDPYTGKSASSGFNFSQQDLLHHDRMPMVMETGSATGSGSDEVFSRSRMSMDYPPDYGLPILPPNEELPSQPSAKTLKVWQRGVLVLPHIPAPGHPSPVFHQNPAPGHPSSAFHQNMSQASSADLNNAYQRCGTDV